MNTQNYNSIFFFLLCGESVLRLKQQSALSLSRDMQTYIAPLISSIPSKFNISGFTFHLTNNYCYSPVHSLSLKTQQLINQYINTNQLSTDSFSFPKIQFFSFLLTFFLSLSIILKHCCFFSTVCLQKKESLESIILFLKQRYK